MKPLSSRVRGVAGALCATAIVWTVVAADEPPGSKTPAEKEYPWDKQAAAYRELFEKVGRAGLSDLMKDQDTGIALHAAWEVHKKLVKSPKPVTPFANRSGETYDPEGMKKFVAFLKERTKAPVPGWWAGGLADLAVWKGAGHHQGTELKRKEVKLGKDVWRVRDGVELALKDGIVSYRSGDVALAFPKGVLDYTGGLEDTLADLVTEKVACLARYLSTGSRLRVAGFDNKSGKHIWWADVWPLRAGLSIGALGRNRVEMTCAGDTMFVFGAGPSGLYAEAFDLETGKCRFRFCTSYWGNPSETWKFNRGG